jgi:hypothetical protein
MQALLAVACSARDRALLTLAGLEPATSWVRSRRSLALNWLICGGFAAAEARSEARLFGQFSAHFGWDRAKDTQFWPDLAYGRAPRARAGVSGNREDGALEGWRRAGAGARAWTRRCRLPDGAHHTCRRAPSANRTGNRSIRSSAKRTSHSVTQRLAPRSRCRQLLTHMDLQRRGLPAAAADAPAPPQPDRHDHAVAGERNLATLAPGRRSRRLNVVLTRTSPSSVSR